MFTELQAQPSARLPLSGTVIGVNRPMEGAQMKRNSKRAIGSLAVAATISALAAPSASALPGEKIGVGTSDAPPATPVRVVTVNSDGGFDWGDAGIGAGAGLALASIGVGSALAVGRRPRGSALAS
jgi:hypothetical protein